MKRRAWIKGFFFAAITVAAFVGWVVMITWKEERSDEIWTVTADDVELLGEEHDSIAGGSGYFTLHYGLKVSNGQRAV